MIPAGLFFGGGQRSAHDISPRFPRSWIRTWSTVYWRRTMKHALSISVLILLSALFSAPSHAQLDIFLKLEGIQGESVDEEHRDEIDVLGWGWQLSNLGTTHIGGGGGAGVSEIGDISIIKNSDLASAPLYLAVMNGELIPEAILTLRRTNQQDGGSPPFPTCFPIEHG